MDLYSKTRDDGLYITENNLLSVLHVIHEQETIFNQSQAVKLFLFIPPEDFFEIDQSQQTTMPTQADVIFLTRSRKTEQEIPPIRNCPQIRDF